MMHPLTLSGRLCRMHMLLAVLPALLALACNRETKVDVARTITPEALPSMSSVNVATYISDSGWAKYKIVTPLWNVYDEADTPYWDFPKGIFLQQYDRKMHVVASVAADSARYLKYEKLWRLDGNVEMHKEPREVFLTQQLFWDERREKIYSDSFIHVETQSHVLEGFGFVSNSLLTTYRVVNPTGIFPVNKENLTPGEGESSSSGAFGDAPPGSEPSQAPASRSVNTKARAVEIDTGE